MKNQLENLNNYNNNNNLSIDKLNLYCITWNLLGKVIFTIILDSKRR